jgi:hypothetical protein
MVAQPASKQGSPGQADAQARLQEAQARLKAATDRHAAVVSVLSRLGVSPQEKRLAQAESKKAEHDLREARRLLQQAQLPVRKP